MTLHLISNGACLMSVATFTYNKINYSGKTKASVNKSCCFQVDLPSNLYVFNFLQPDNSFFILFSLRLLYNTGAQQQEIMTCQMPGTSSLKRIYLAQG